MSSEQPTRQTNITEWASATGNLRCARDRVGRTTVFRLCGEVDIATAPLLATALEGDPGAETTATVLDLAGVDFIDSAGITVLVQADARARDSHRHLTLTAVPAGIERTLSIAGVRSRVKVA